jgi:hypothetical protein
MRIRGTILKAIFANLIKTLFICSILLLFIYIFNGIFEGETKSLASSLVSRRYRHTYFEYYRYIVAFVAANIFIIYINLDTYRILVNKKLSIFNTVCVLMPIALIHFSFKFLDLISNMYRNAEFDNYFVMYCMFVNVLNILFYLYCIIHSIFINKGKKISAYINTENVNSLLIIMRYGSLSITLMFLILISSHLQLNIKNHLAQQTNVVILIISIMLFLIQSVYIIHKIISNFINNFKIYKGAYKTIASLADVGKGKDFINVFIIIKDSCFRIGYQNGAGKVLYESTQYQKLIKGFNIDDKEVKIQYITEDIYENIPDKIKTYENIIILYVNLISKQFFKNLKSEMIPQYIEHMKRLSQEGCSIRFINTDIDFFRVESYKQLEKSAHDEGLTNFIKYDYFNLVGSEVEFANLNNIIKEIIESTYFCIGNSKIIDNFIIEHSAKDYDSCLLKNTLLKHLTALKNENNLIEMFNRVLKLLEFQIHIVSVLNCGIEIDRNNISFDELHKKIRGASIGKWINISRELINLNKDSPFNILMKKKIDKGAITCMKNLYKSISIDTKVSVSNLEEVSNAVVSFRNKTIGHGIVIFEIMYVTLLDLIKLYLYFLHELINLPFILILKDDHVTLEMDGNYIDMNELIKFENNTLYLLTSTFIMEKEYIDYLSGYRITTNKFKIRLDERLSKDE